MLCPNCGKEIGNAMFCTYCGTNVSQQSAGAQQPYGQSGMQQPYGQPGMQQPYSQPNMQQPYGQMYTQQPKKKSSTGIIIAIVAVIAVLSIVTALLAPTMLKKKSLVGKWQNTDDSITAVMEFNKDGTGKMTVSGFTLDIVYVTSGNQLTITMSFMGSSETETFTYQLSNNGKNLILSKDGDTETWVRVKK